MNILLLSQFFSITKGGGEYVFKLMAKNLTENGHKVWVITNKVKGETYPNLANLKIIMVNPTLEYKGGLPPTFLDNIRYVINTFQAGKKIIKEQNIDIIHSNNFSPSLAGSLMSYFTKKPHIITIFDIFSQNDKDFWRKWIKQVKVSKINAILVPWFEKILIKTRYDAIYTISDASKNDILKMNTKKPIYNIPPSIEDTVQLNEKIIPFQFICISRLVFYKNLEIIINAMSVVVKSIPQCKVIIIGDGPHKESLQILIKNLELEKNIIFKGYTTSAEKMKLISESNAMLFPSILEGFGLVILEAFSQSKPVLVSDIPPMSDIIIHNETGFVLDENNYKIWAEHITKLIKNPQLSKKMGENGNNLLKIKYNRKQFYDKLIKMYNDIASDLGE
ncbi:glycosyltransferase family 4 protein [Nitrosopumilus piranensis]|uniref:Glycosyltransferase n=1 Tax=Nitrosopumilus piranensis TaxID=1582439 RepID=A0A0C5BSL8_9ARCH|nr:glycosyltransferase family 4 protein [Nitrosopumilus piranensis]AJM91301.1 Glycosyltransferase [Nitrosopumilus piranensis]